MKIKIAVVAIIVLVFLVFLVRYRNNMTKNIVSPDNYIRLTTVEQTDTPNFFIIHFELRCPTIGASVQYNGNPFGINPLSKVQPPSGQVIKIIAPAKVDMTSRMSFGDLRANGSDKPEDSLIVPLDSKIPFRNGDNIPLFKFTDAMGKVYTASLIALSE